MLPSITNSAECSKCQTLIPIKTEYDSDPDYKPEEFSGEIDPMQYVGVLHGSDELLKQEPMIGNYETNFNVQMPVVYAHFCHEYDHINWFAKFQA